MGKLYCDKSGGWVVDWVFVDGGKELNKWFIRDIDVCCVMVGGVDGVVDVLVWCYVKVGVVIGMVGIYWIVVIGIYSVEDYMCLVVGLCEILVVCNVVLVCVVGDCLELVLDMIIGLVGLNCMFGDNGVLVLVVLLFVLVDGDEFIVVFVLVSNEYCL